MATAPTMTPDCAALFDSIHRLCCKHQVWFAVHFNEHDHSWYVNIDSPAPSERWCGRDRGQLSVALDDAYQEMQRRTPGGRT